MAKKDEEMEQNPPGPSWDQDAEIQHWKQEYDSIREQLTNLKPENDVLGELEQLEADWVPPEVDNRRATPRYLFPGDRDANIFAHMGPKAFRIINISVGGVAFYSDVSFEPGGNILLSALGMVALDVEVVSCELEETDSAFMEFQYLVRAQFSERVNGYLVYVLSREMYLKQLRDD